MSDDFKKKRIDYLNNWPNVKPFEIEKLYYEKVERFKLLNETIIVPFPLEVNNDTDYNKSISFMIDAFEQIEKHPNFSYEFVFKAYDRFIEQFYPSRNITYSSKMLCDNEWFRIISSNSKLMQAFEKLFSIIPVKACQYVYIRLDDRNGSYKRLIKDPNGNDTPESIKRKQLIDDIESKYGRDFLHYSDSIRKASMLCRRILKQNTININTKVYSISFKDKLHILVSGFLYTFRNDMMHGSNISITKSSKTTLGTYAVDYYAFLLMYYLLIILMIDKFPGDYSPTVYDDLAHNIGINIEKYKQLFGKEIEK